MSIQKGRTAKKTAKSQSNGKHATGDQARSGILSFSSAQTGIAQSDHMTLAIDEIYRHAASGEGVSPSTQAHTMLSAIGKMLALENLKLRVGQFAQKNGAPAKFFLGSGNE